MGCKEVERGRPEVRMVGSSSWSRFNSIRDKQRRGQIGQTSTGSDGRGVGKGWQGPAARSDKYVISGLYKIHVCCLLQRSFLVIF